MNARAIVLVSLLCNVGLLAWAYHLRASRSSALHGPSVTQTVSDPASVASLRDAPRTETKRDFVTNEVTAEFRWQQVESRDFKAYIANLRAIGCPEETIRDIIGAEVNKLFAQKRRALFPEMFGDEYWKKDPSWRAPSSTETDRQKASRALEKERTELLTSLLGVDPQKERNKELGYVDYWERMYGFLSADKQQQVRDLSEQFDEKLQTFYRMRMRDEEDEQAIRKLQREKLAAVAAILSPQEFDEFEMRTSQIANQMRYDLEGFNPTENEFREIYKLRKDREDDLAYVYDPDDEQRRLKREEAVKEVDQQIKSKIGEQRFEEFKRAQDYSYKELVRTLSRNDLPAQIANTVYDLKKVAEDEAKKIRQDQSFSREQREEALKMIRSETEAAMIQQMGDKAFNSYKRGGGHWLKSLGRETLRIQ